MSDEHQGWRATVEGRFAAQADRIKAMDEDLKALRPQGPLRIILATLAVVGSVLGAGAWILDMVEGGMQDHSRRPHAGAETRQQADWRYGELQRRIERLERP